MEVEVGLATFGIHKDCFIALGCALPANLIKVD